MKRWFGKISMLLIVTLLIQPLPVSVEAADSAPLFEDSFAGGLGNWDMFGSTAWQTAGSGAEAVLTGSTTATSPQRAIVKTSSLPYSSKDYVMEFTAKGDRFRALFRYSSGTSYYFMEFKNSSFVELWKYPESPSAVQVGASADISAAVHGFQLADTHSYRIEINGSGFSLLVDGAKAAAFNDSSLAAGGVGFSLKSIGPAVHLSVDRIAVWPLSSQSAFGIVHTPLTEVPYNADVPVAFTVANAASAVTAQIRYAYGSDGTEQTVQASGGGRSYSGTIPGTNRSDRIRYYITAQDSSGQTARYPATGAIEVAIREITPYRNDFEAEPANTAPVGWSVTGAGTKVIQLPDGNKVLNLNGSGSAKLNLPMYQNADNFVVKFKAKYERTSTAVQNTWRLRYRAADDANNNALEWATHNSKYFLMRKTTLGGNYYIANYVKSLLGDWHDYELRVSGITHKLLIDGVETASGDDSDPLALKKGYFQWNVVGGINLMIDDFSIDPLPVPYVIDLQPAGNYAGIYSKEESPGLSLALEAGAEPHELRIDYTVRRADGDGALAASGSKTYSLARYANQRDTIPFTPDLKEIGTYEVSADFTVDGVKQPEQSKRMRLAIITKAAPIPQADLDNESKFGLNTHYALNWRDDIIDGARKMGARSHRSGISWEDVDRNMKDSSGRTVYNYSGTDSLLNKLFSYGFNQIPVLGIDRNAYYQQGTANTPAALKAMGDFVANAVSRYKGKIRQWEMPNEPEIFSKPYIPEEFVQLQKTAYLAMKKADPDAMLLAGDHTSSVLSVLPSELELGSFDYADAYSYHPYVYNSMPDGNLQNMMDGVKQLVNAYGGWKDYYLTEGGWPTAKAGYPSVSEETQRDYIVRAFLNYMITDQVKVYEYYNYKNDGTDDRYYDIFWGITDNDGRPKLAYTAVNQLMTSLDKARYVGTYDTGDADVAVQVFLNEGLPVTVAWRKVDHKDDPAVRAPESAITLPFAAAGVKLKNVNGAELPVTGAGGGVQITVSGSPVYLTGVPEDFVLGAAAQLLKNKAQEAAAKLDRMRTPANAVLVDGDKAELSRITMEWETALGSGRSSSGLEQGIKDIYRLMTRIAGQIEAGSLERAPGYVALEALYNAAESASVTLSYTLQGVGANTLDYAAAVQTATAAFNTKKGDYSVMPVSASAVLRMNRYGRLAEAASARGSYADSYAYNLLAREFAGAALAIVRSEPVKFVGVKASVVPTEITGEAGHPSGFQLSLVNDTDTPQPVTVRMKLPEGWEAAQTDPAEATVMISPHASLDRLYQVKVPDRTVKGRYEIALDIVFDGAVLDTKKVQLTIEDGIGLKLLPVKKTIEQLDVVSVQLTGTSSFEKSGRVTVKGPDGVALEPITSDTFSSLKKGDRLQLDFRWTYHKPAAFNEYGIDLQVEDTASGKVIFRDPAMPVDFNLVQKAQAITIDGDLSDWNDAYPFHLRRNDQNADGFHDPGNLEATAYAKWAEDGMYFAVSVRDNIHKQSENAANMWKNDSVQISLDPLSNREAPYGADDTEWGFALTNDGSLPVHIFYSAPPNPNGEVSGRVPFKAVRDETAKRTIYEFKIPSAYVKDLKPGLGGKIGLNVAVNDADLQNGRDNFIQWTPGTADSKNTALYDAFTFIDYQPQLPATGVSGVAVQPEELLLQPGQGAALIAVVTPKDATDKSLSWSTSNASVAEVTYGGVVTGVSEGRTAVTATTTDGSYKASAAVIVDGTPPVTADDAAPGWQRAGQTVTLSVYDALSGTARTEYRLDDRPLSEGTSVQVNGDGMHVLVYTSTDRAGNREVPKTAVIRIDSAPPSFQVIGPLTVSRAAYGTLTFVAEDTLSGVKEVSYRLDGKPIQSPYTIEPMSLSVGEHQLMLEGTDAAGNKTTVQQVLTVMLTVEELGDLIRYGYNKGWIDGRGIRDSLLAKVEAALKDAARGNQKFDFTPLIHEMEAQAGKHIDAAFASRLLEDIEYLRRSMK
ncbi:sugar-binding protein [Paenibacillus sp. 32352]|uniref:OmpL47-type beta-barrel domain-containing protein n=1 Tax=Paenibacillus sp. 32352 TaxID=1969111 RepID=UPI0009AE5187|nr:sugar-binding protein [Paenibacillus sp. 32352]